MDLILQELLVKYENKRSLYAILHQLELFFAERIFNTGKIYRVFQKEQ